MVASAADKHYKGCSSELAGGKNSPGAAVEHTSVEVDTLVPAVEAELPLLVDQGLVVVVVLADDTVPVVHVEEGLDGVGHLIESLVGLFALSERLAEPVLRRHDLLVAAGVLFLAVELVGPDQLPVEAVVALGAADEVVTDVRLLLSVGVHEASSPLGSVALIERVLPAGVVVEVLDRVLSSDEGVMRSGEDVAEHG